MRLNLNQFKKVSENPSQAVLSHPDGHKITVSKSALKRQQLKELSQLPMYDEGGAVLDADRAPAGAGISLDLNPSAPTEAAISQGYNAINPPAPNPLANLEQFDLLKNRNAAPFFGQPDALGLSGIKKGVRGSLPSGQGQRGGAIPVTNYRPDASAEAAGYKPIPFPNYMNMINQGFQTTAQGVEQEGAAKTMLGNEQVKAADRYQQQTEPLAKSYQDHLMKLNGEVSNAIQDYKNGHIDANRYMNNLSTPGRVSTIIGLFLGGVGAGLLGQENQALKFLNAQIDRDVEAQKAEMGKKENIMSAYYHQYGNLDAATRMTHAFYIDKYSNDLQKAAAKAASPAAAAAVKQALGPLQIQKAQMLGPLAMQQAMMARMQQGGFDPAQAVRFMVPEHQQKDAYEEVGKAQEIEKLRTALNQSAEHLKTMIFNGTFSPADRESAVETYAPIITKMSAGRFNLEEAKSLTRSLFPNRFESAETTRNKDERRDTFLDIFRNEPTLKGNNINIPSTHVRKNPAFIPRKP